MPILALAQTDSTPQDKRWYISPFGSMVKTGGAMDGDDGWGAGMGVGKILNEHFNVELKGFHQAFGNGDKGVNPTNVRNDLNGASADVQYYFLRSSFSPYTVLGLGGMIGAVPGNADSFLTTEAGAGFTYEFDDNFLFRSDVRYRYANNFDAASTAGSNEFHDMTFNVGFVVPFGAKPKAVAPKPYIAPPPPPEVESCATMDSDGDGIDDCNDKCPGTLPGAKCDDQGCPISLELKGVLFEYDSAVLMPEALHILDGIAENLIAFPQPNDIEVHGHTSSEGSDAYNMKLSQRRSQSVVNYLKQKGVSNHLYARGFGESRPVADNSTEEGRSKNRRSELIWSERK
jgi:OOP family OmpA-OmpF porin